MTPVTDEELDGLEMFNVTTSARAAADKAKRRLAPAAPHPERAQAEAAEQS